jgi:purine-nucleoside phosphorylase
LSRPQARAPGRARLEDFTMTDLSIAAGEAPAAAAALQARFGARRPRVAVVLGTGWGGLTQHLQDADSIAYTDLPGFPRLAVAGHAGRLHVGRLGAQCVAVLSGRKHAYEAGDAAAMTVPVRALRAWGCDVLVLTNAAGSLQPAMPPGSLMLISDHLNLPQRSPLVGLGGNERFVAMTEAYDPALRAAAQAVARAQGMALHEGVYAWALGPQFETPAEIRMMARLGADAVGMSTVPETILARHAGLRVLALSLITNLAAGLSDEELSHAHTQEQAAQVQERVGAFLAALLAAL